MTRSPTFAIARRGIAYVPEGRGIFASLSVAENLAIAERGGDNGQRRWTVERVLELFPRLAQRRANRGDQLSGGEQQMLAIGRALLDQPAPAHPRRGHRGPGAHHPRRDLAHHPR